MLCEILSLWFQENLENLLIVIKLNAVPEKKVISKKNNKIKNWTYSGVPSSISTSNVYLNIT